MTQLQAVREFASVAIGERVTIARNRYNNNWGMDVYNKPNPRMIVPKVIDYPPEVEDKMFRADFVRRCPFAAMFNDVTLSILHELGHWATRASVDWMRDYEDRKGLTIEEYFTLYSERIATDWAINWLWDLEHWAIAKQFEADFMGK